MKIALTHCSDCLHHTHLDEYQRQLASAQAPAPADQQAESLSHMHWQIAVNGDRGDVELRALSLRWHLAPAHTSRSGADRSQEWRGSPTPTRRWTRSGNGARIQNRCGSWMAPSRTASKWAD